MEVMLRPLDSRMLPVLDSLVGDEHLAAYVLISQ